MQVHNRRLKPFWKGFLLSLSFLFFIASAALFGQEQTENNAEGNGETVALNEAGSDQAQYNFSPAAKTDLRFNMKDISVNLRMDPYARGEFLDVVFTLKNNTQKAIDLYGYVLAYHESDAVDRATRLWIPYPDWRTKDPAKNTYLIKEMSVSPSPIDQNKIWNESDEEYIRFHRILNRIRNSVGARKPIAEVYPPIYRYLNYISLRPTDGLSFRIYGDQSPPRNNTVITNYPEIKKDATRYEKFKNVTDHTYTVQFKRWNTTFRSHHFLGYGPGFRMFNKIVVVLFDAEKSQEYAQMSQEQKAKSESPMVFYRTYSIDRDLEIQ